jgi:hypothetical protein
MTSVPIARGPVSSYAALMASTDETGMTERARAEERVRAIVEELDRPTLALLYKTLHDALGFRIETVDGPGNVCTNLVLFTFCPRCDDCRHPRPSPAGTTSSDASG